MNKLLLMFRIFPIIIVILIIAQEVYACEGLYYNQNTYNSYNQYDCSYGDNENRGNSLKEWNNWHTGNYIQKVNDDFYIIPNTPHSIQIREISDTMIELDVQ